MSPHLTPGLVPMFVRMVFGGRIERRTADKQVYSQYNRRMVARMICSGSNKIAMAAAAVAYEAWEVRTVEHHLSPRYDRLLAPMR